MRRWWFLLLALPAGYLFLLVIGTIDVAHNRWPVKTFRDQDRSRVRLEPVETTIAALTRVPRPSDAAFRSRRRIAQEELTVYRVHGTFRRLMYGADGDIHLVLEDPADRSRAMIAEIPLPLFSIGSGFGKVFRAERSEVARRRAWQGAAVEVTGVGFFDYHLHRLAGKPTNGLELHPVIGLRFLDGRGPRPRPQNLANTPAYR